MRDEGATNPRNRRKNNNEKCAAVILKDPDIDISQLFDNEADSCDKDEADEGWIFFIFSFHSLTLEEEKLVFL